MNLLREYLKENTLFTDGAMGTYYSSQFPDEDILVEKANTLYPEHIVDIHMEYLQSGARLIRTNTFATNGGFFEGEQEIKENIEAGYALAKQAIDTFCAQNGENPKDYFIAADIGTIFDLGQKDESAVLKEYRFIVDCFLSAGAEVFLLETQSDVYYVNDIVEDIKSKNADAFVIVTFSFDKTGYTKSGLRFERMIRLMNENSLIDGYGLNCGVEAAHMYQMLKNVIFPSEKPIFALPNAGYPYQLRGKTIYGKNAGYFCKMLTNIFALGIDAIGGCCGTTPDYFGDLYKELGSRQKPKKNIGSLDETVVTRTESDFWKKLHSGEKPMVVELDPPSDLSVEKILDGAELLKEHRVDLLTLSDSPMARSRMDASLLGQRVQREVGISVMPHISCRDRNIISLRGTMLGDYINDIKHFLIVTGDPVTKNDRSTITQVFDYNSIKFMGLIQEMNEDQFASDKVVYGGALNYHGVNIDAIVRRMESKMKQGCSFFLTQPIYSDEDVERIGQLREMTGAKILGGIMPLVSRKNALFIANEMPGMRVPDEIVDAYGENMTREEAEKVAVSVSLEIAKKLENVTDGYYFMTPFNRVSLICRIIDEIRRG